MLDIEFFKNMDDMFKGNLNHPVPALIIAENKAKLKVEAEANDAKLKAEIKEIAIQLLQAKPGENNEKFKKALKEGKLLEKLVAKLMELKGQKFIGFSVGKEPKYDIETELTTGTRIKYECKIDVWSFITDNIAIEESRINKFTGAIELTGIHVWDCTYVIYYFPQTQTLYIIKLTDLKECYELAKEDSKGGKSQSGTGEGGRTTNFLLQKKFFHSFMKNKYVDKKGYTEIDLTEVYN